jgi:phage shock protein A
MFKFLRQIWVIVRGWLIRTGDDLVSSGPDRIKSTYAAAIQDAMKQYQDMKVGLGMIMQQKTRLQNILEHIEDELKSLDVKFEGALQAAQMDPDSERHRQEGQRFLERMEKLDKKKGRTTIELEQLASRLEEYKGKLTEMYAEVDRLRKEKGEMVAEFISAQSTLRLEEKLAGLPSESTIDEAVVAVRERVENLKAQVQIATEMRGAITEKDSLYEELGANKRVESAFDKLLKARTTVVKTNNAVSTDPEPEMERVFG